MNTTYTLTEGNESLNRVLLMMRYDLGKTLSENIVLEQPDSKFDTPQTREFMRKHKPAKTMTLDEFMEDFRETLTHPAMVGLEVFLLSSGIGIPAVVASYSALLVYDIYKGVTKGEWGWFDIVFEVLAIVSSGALTQPLKPLLNAARKLKLNTLDKVLTYLSKTKYWPKIKGFLNSGINMLKSLSSNIGKFFKWISEKTGFKFVEGIPSKVQGFLNSIINGLTNFVKSVVEPFSRTTTKKAAIRGTKYGLGAGAIKKGSEAYSDYKSDKLAKTIGDSEADYD
jgi:hypothetical protein